MFERFTTDARQTVVLAQECAAGRKDVTVTPVDLLLALTRGPLGPLLADAGVTQRAIEASRAGTQPGSVDDDTALRSIGIDLHAIRASIESAFGQGALDAVPTPRRSRPPWGRVRGGHIPFGGTAKETLSLGLRETVRLDATAIGTESIMLGLLRTFDPALENVFEQASVDRAGLRARLEGRIRKTA